MWMGKQLVKPVAGEPAAGVGTVSVGGETPAVVTDGEQRMAKIFSPGGYCWRPAADDQVLLIQSGEPCLVGSAQKCPVALAAGEVYLHCGGASVHLRKNGEVVVTGTVRLAGDLHVGGRLFVGGVEVKGESGLGA